ncbi:MAG: sporulation protein YhbH [Armatimonadota bacterium]|nr:sporulation protein YhbH [Armatimonadota bacterium]
MAMGISNHDWTLHRKGPADQERHKQRIKEAIRQNLADIVSEENIILSDGKKTIKVPIRSLEEYRFRFDPRKDKGVGQGNGKSKVGDVIGQSQDPGTGEPGTEPGDDYYEADVSVDELAELIFEDLGLPRLEEKRDQEIESEAVRFVDIRKTGIFSNLDKKRTIRENVKRNAMAGKAEFKDLKNEDLRFKAWDREIRFESNAVVIAMMDVSGSMGQFEKYIARSFYFWMVRFLRTKYQNVKIVFLSHHTEAKEVTEQEFFTKGESGGTRVSSVYRLALDIIAERFPPSDWNIYPFHFSDGDNQSSDNDTCVDLAEELIGQCNLFGYGEIHETQRYFYSTLMSAFNAIDDEKFIGISIAEKSDVYAALRRFFARDEAAVQAKA